MVKLLHKQHAMSDRFISHMLARNIRIEEDLIDLQARPQGQQRTPHRRLARLGHGGDPSPYRRRQQPVPLKDAA
jgi:hypothetical protein